MKELLDRLVFKVSLKFNPHDVWVGIYWKFNRATLISSYRLQVYIYLIPMLPIKLDLVVLGTLEDYKDLRVFERI
mgnify:FL=1